MKRLLLLGLLAGCGDLQPEVGALRAGTCVDRDSDPSTPVRFEQDILPIIQGDNGCRCHLPEQTDPIGFVATGLDLSNLDALRRGGANSGSDIVIPGQACRSILYLKTSPAPPFGSRMPFDGPPMLSDAQRQLIKDWIVEGALP